MKNSALIKLRSTIATVLFILLSGCLQVELVGPVVGARVFIETLRDGVSVVQGELTAGPQEVSDAIGQELWDSLDAKAKLIMQGGIQVSGSELKNKTFYLVTATGGVDMDFNGDGQEDSNGVPVARPLHAILTGRQLKKGARVNLMSEAIYQNIKDEIDDLSDQGLRDLLNERAARVVGDVNGDGTRNHLDVVKWSQVAGNHKYKGSTVLFDRLVRSYGDSIYTDGVRDTDVVNAVMSAKWRPARPDSEYGSDLIGCSVAVTVGDVCSLGELPLLGMERSNPTVDDVMERVIVSHTWMAQRFEEFLYEAPDDLLLMFRSMAGIVIDADTNPSFYRGSLATIYLSGDYFWRTEKEGESITAEEDYRAEFAKAVEFADLWRYVLDNERAVPRFYDVDENGNRTLDHVVKLAAPLLFHELAHATDFFRPELFDQIQRSLKPYEVDIPLASTELTDSDPLLSSELFGIANVLFGGFDATDVEAKYTPEEIGTFFEPDGASDLYGYYTQFEDTAMLFEESMMAIHYGFSRDVAFTTVPESNEDDDCSDYRVGWGVRGRIAEPQVSLRARDIVSKLLPERDYTQELTTLPTPVSMDITRDWCDNIDLSGNADAQSARVKSATKRLKPEPAPERRRFH
ncbi:MAG: hypothetical protein AB8B81_10565 [Halioglobus sp.]